MASQLSPWAFIQLVFAFAGFCDLWLQLVCVLFSWAITQWMALGSPLATVCLGTYNHHLPV